MTIDSGKKKDIKLTEFVQFFEILIANLFQWFVKTHYFSLCRISCRLNNKLHKQRFKVKVIYVGMLTTVKIHRS